MAYTDILVNLQRNPAFLKKINKLNNDIILLERDSGLSPESPEVVDVLREIYRVCGFNAGLLLPYFFPSCAALKGKKLTLMRRPFAFCFYHMGIGFVLCIKGSRQISKTSNLICRYKINTHLLPSYKILHIVPHQSHLKTFGTKFREMERDFRFHASETSDPRFRNNLYLKEYPNNSLIQMFHVLGSVDHVRSVTADEIAFDEYQLFDTYFEEDILQTAKTSDLKNRLYTGTSTTTDSPLETMYQDGSQGVWHVRCDNGNKWLDMSSQEHLWSIMSPLGPTCPYTRKPLNMTDGEFVHARPEMLLVDRPSFHVPQVIIPDYAHDTISWKTDIYDKWFRNQHNPKKILQELFGIAVEEGGRELTEQHLKDMCNPAWTEASMKTRLSKYRFIVSGCDWGGSDYNQAERTKASYTVHVILGINHDGTFDILHMRQYAGMEFEYIADEICNKHKEFGAHALASDYGGGQGYNNLLRKHAKMDATRCFVFFYSAPVTAPVKVSDNSYYNMFSLNRTESITSLYTAIKNSPSRIRCFNYEEAKERLLEFLNMRRIPTDKDHGVATFRYQRHGAKPDDTLHAVNFGFALGRMMLNEPLMEDPAVKARLIEVFGGSMMGNMQVNYPGVNSSTPYSGWGGGSVAG